MTHPCNCNIVHIGNMYTFEVRDNRTDMGSLIKVKYWMNIECRPKDSQKRLYLQGQMMQLPTVIILRNSLHNCFSNAVSKSSIICGNIAWFMNYFSIAEALHSCVWSWGDISFYYFILHLIHDYLLWMFTRTCVYASACSIGNASLLYASWSECFSWIQRKH